MGKQLPKFLASVLNARQLVAASNLADLASASAARANLGLGALALLSALPAPSPAALGGVLSRAAQSSRWLNSLGTDGTWTATQPAFSDLSGVAAAAQLPAPTLTAFGGAQALAASAGQYLTGLGTDGVFTRAAVTVPTVADSAATVGLTRSVGTSSNFKRSDASDPLDTTANWVWTGKHAWTPGSNVPDSLRINDASGNALIKAGSLVGATTWAALYFGNTTPTGSNYVLTGDTTSTILNAPTVLGLRTGNTTYFQINGSAITASGPTTFSASGAASAPATKWTGTRKTNGTATTNQALLLVEENTATASTTWDTAGCAQGWNIHGTGKIWDGKTDGITVGSLDYAGNGVFAGGLTVGAASAFTGTVTFSNSGGAELRSGETAHWGLLGTANLNQPIGLNLSSSGGISWANTTNYGQPKDVQLTRASAGVLALTGSLSMGGPITLKTYTVATLPTPGTGARIAYATDGRNAGEGAGVGTGVPVRDNGSAWKTFYDNSTVAA